VLKLILAFVIALSLVGSPGQAQAAPSASCTMPGADSGSAADHEKMGCCTPDCATPCPPAMLSNSLLGVVPLEPAALAVWLPTHAGLTSSNPAAADPPPRNLA